MATAKKVDTGTTKKVTKIVEVEVPVQRVVLDMSMREAAYVYMVLSRVSNNKREWGTTWHHPVYVELDRIFHYTQPIHAPSFDYDSLNIKDRDWVASQ